MKTSRILSAAVAAASLFSFATANATPPTGTTLQGNGTLTVQATVTGGCTVGSPTLNFGGYPSNSASAIPGSTTFSVNCASGKNYSIGLSTGGNPGGVTGRQMTDGLGNFLSYDLTDSLGNPWDDTTNYVTGTGTGLAQTITINGSIPALQNVPLGSYSDTVNINVYF